MPDSRDLTPPKLSKEPKYDFQKVKGDEIKDLRQAWADGDSFLEKVGNLVTKTAAGRNTVGRVLGSAIDVALMVAPHGSKIDRVRRTAKSALGLNTRKFQHNPNPMDKPKYLSKTVWSSIIIALTAILQAAGVEFVSDPQTMQTVYTLMYSLAGAFGLYGLRDAVGKMKEQDK